MTNGNSSREIILDILLEILEKGSYSHIVLSQALSKYQYLDKQERAFISRIVEGTVEYTLQLDYVINSYSSVKVKKMKPVIRTLLRMSVYQILYMDRLQRGGKTGAETEIHRIKWLCQRRSARYFQK